MSLWVGVISCELLIYFCKLLRFFYVLGDIFLDIYKIILFFLDKVFVYLLLKIYCLVIIIKMIRLIKVD